MMGSLDRSLDFWMNASSEQKSVMAQQMATQQMMIAQNQAAQQGYSSLDPRNLQASYTHGWSDPSTIHVFGGNDPQRAYVEIKNDPQTLAEHLMKQRHAVKPIDHKVKAALFVGLGIVLVVLTIGLKVIGII